MRTKHGVFFGVAVRTTVVVMLAALFTLAGCDPDGGSKNDPGPDPNTETPGGVTDTAANNADFGEGAAIAGTKTVATVEDWNNLMLSPAGNWIVNITGDITGAEEFYTNTANNKVSFRGTGSVERGTGGNSSASLLVISANTEAILRGPTFKGAGSGTLPVVTVQPNGTFTMREGTISGGNRGVSVEGNTSGNTRYAVFTMYGGTISGNTGGGVYLGSAATFTMSGGTISGNTSASFGGGVNVSAGAGTTFTKTGGTIYGDTDNTHTDGSTENTAAADSANPGHAVYISGTKYRNTDAGPAVNLSNSGTENWNQ